MAKYQRINSKIRFYSRVITDKPYSVSSKKLKVFETSTSGVIHFFIAGKMVFPEHIIFLGHGGKWNTIEIHDDRMVFRDRYSQRLMTIFYSDSACIERINYYEGWENE